MGLRGRRPGAIPGTAFRPDAPRVVDDAYSAGGVFGARELATDPSEATRILLDRFFVSFIHEGHDVVGSLRERVPI